MGDESPPEVPAPAEVEPGLWTCAEVAVPAALADASLGITHLVSIGCPPPDDPTGGVRTVETLRLDLEDEDDGDLLTQIPDTVAFIRGGLSARQRGSPPGETSGDGAADAPDAKSVGGVLVHCHAGQSRSVAVAMAHIMRARGLEVAEALRVCQKNNPAASPNAGFIAQLTLWSSMDCKLNMADEAYRMYVVAKMAREREYNGYVQATSVRPDPGLSSSWLSSSGATNVMPFVGTDAASLAPVGPPNGGGAEAGVAISCRKCRRLGARREYAAARARRGHGRAQLARALEGDARDFRRWHRARSVERGFERRSVPQRLPGAPGVDEGHRGRSDGGQAVLPEVRREGGPLQLGGDPVRVRRVGRARVLRAERKGGRHAVHRHVVSVVRGRHF